MILPDLPISDALPALLRALSQRGVAVLQAPPGAGKTTVVPLALLQAGFIAGRIIMLEPRRLATRAAAERMADTLGEKVGQTVGYRIRGESRVCDRTRIEVVTEGILTRMIQSDPSLDGIGAVIFDEFHERSLNGDLGLALVWETRSALRDDLAVLVMSATLDAEPVAEMLDAPVITSQGRAFDVQTHWLQRPIARGTRFETALADLVLQATSETTGGILVFLPGEGEIRRVQRLLQGRLPKECVIHPLFGAMDFRAQRAAIAPATSGRKVVLATSIAETSLTIAGITVVVDGGRARRARFDPGSGMSRLITERATKAECEQRRGRAGRVAAGHCYRLWTQGEDGGMAPFPPCEIEAGDLCALVLDLALWGARGTGDMAFLTPPNPGGFAGAQALLQDIGALDDKFAITAHGRKIAKLPLHPRLAHMVVLGGPQAPLLAALLGERDPLRGAGVDLNLRRNALQIPKIAANGPGARSTQLAFERIRREARRLSRHSGENNDVSWGGLAALAYPDRIGLRRNGPQARWILSGGKGAFMDDADPMAGARLIVATDLDGDAREARVRQAIEVREHELRQLFAQKIAWENTCHWSRRERRVLARRREKLGALVFQDLPWKAPPPEAIANAALDGVRDLGLPWSGAARQFAVRVEMLRASGHEMPEMGEDALTADIANWLLPHLNGIRSEADIKQIDLLGALRGRLDWDQKQLLERAAPSHFVTPMNNRIAIDYSGQSPEISLRLQEMFGLTTHPVVAGKPLRITLLSPARRPLQTTTDLPGFWATSYGDVRKDMRGRYPKHPWPEDPTKAQPTLRAKPRKS